MDTFSGLIWLRLRLSNAAIDNWLHHNLLHKMERDSISSETLILPRLVGKSDNASSV